MGRNELSANAIGASTHQPCSAINAENAKPNADMIQSSAARRVW